MNYINNLTDLNQSLCSKRDFKVLNANISLLLQFVQTSIFYVNTNGWGFISERHRQERYAYDVFNSIKYT